jgi:hypothetical protein
MNGKTAKLGRAYAIATKTDPREFKAKWKARNHRQKGRLRRSAEHAISVREGYLDLNT